MLKFPQSVLVLWKAKYGTSVWGFRGGAFECIYTRFDVCLRRLYGMEQRNTRQYADKVCIIRVWNHWKVVKTPAEKALHSLSAVAGKFEFRKQYEQRKSLVALMRYYCDKTLNRILLRPFNSRNQSTNWLQSSLMILSWRKIRIQYLIILTTLTVLHCCYPINYGNRVPNSLIISWSLLLFAIDWLIAAIIGRLLQLIQS